MVHQHDNDAPIESQPDPLAALHRMSTTAGAASQEYVAINTAALFALVLGLLSGLALLGNLLLIVPAVAIVVAIVALRQIARSNGTQGGRFFAIAGLLLALGCGTGVLAWQASQARRLAPEKQQISSLVATFGQQVGSENWQQAYELFSSRFKEKVPLDLFVQRLKSVQSPDLYGKLISTRDNGLIEIQGNKTASCMAMVKFQKTDNARWVMAFRKNQDQWQIDALPDLFPPETPAPPPSPR